MHYLCFLPCTSSESFFLQTPRAFSGFLFGICDYEWKLAKQKRDEIWQKGDDDKIMAVIIINICGLNGFWNMDGRILMKIFYIILMEISSEKMI